MIAYEAGVSIQVWCTTMRLSFV